MDTVSTLYFNVKRFMTETQSRMLSNKSKLLGGKLHIEPIQMGTVRGYVFLEE